MTFHSIKIYLAKKGQKQFNQRLVLKQLRMSDFLITIEEYVGARETPSSTTHRKKNIKGTKRHKDVKGNIKQIEVMFAHLVKGCCPL